MTRNATTTMLILVLLLSAAAAYAQEPLPPADEAPPPPTAWDEPGQHLRGPMHRGGPEARHGRDMLDSPEQIDDVLEVLEQVNPQLAQRIEQIRDRHPQEVARTLHPHIPYLRRLVYLKRNDPDHYALRVRDIQIERECAELAQQAREAEALADPEQVEQLRQDLRDAVSEHFEIRQELRERQLARLEQRIADLRGQIEDRRAARDELIQQRIDQLTADAGHPQW